MLKRMAPAIATSGERRDPYWARSVTEVLHDLETLEDGLTSAEVEARLRRYGTSVKRRGRTGLDLLLRQFVNPIILLLVGATFVSLALGDSVDAAIILVIVGLSGLLGFYQERGAIQVVEALLATVQVHCEVRRNGTITSVPLEQVVPGDLIVLNAGDVIPGDCRVIEAKDLLVDESPLTGESYPAEKDGGLVPTESPVRKRSNSLFMGTHVASGTGTAVVVHTGGATEFGQISRLLAEKHLPTSFERGITRFGYMLVSATAVLVVGIFIVNVILDRPLLDSLLFSLALAVGLTLQMLPPIVTITLSRGAHRMAQKMVIVKRLDAIEDFGSMNVLCTDKTGTLTRGSVELAQTLDITGRHSDSVHAYAYLNAVHQHGLTNPIDDAIVARPPAEEVSVTRLDEIPYDFVRKRLSVLVAEGDRSLLITKGALDQILTACSTARAPSGGTMPLPGGIPG